MKRLTLRGSDALERSLATTVERIAELVVRTAGEDHVTSLLLIGGYGRGEGGVERVDGVERAHNNLDFLLFTRGIDGSGRQALRTRLEHVLEDEGLPVPADVGVLDERALDHADGKVMWFDVRGGHRVVRGRAPAALARFSLETVPATDMRALVVNRATLLLLNAELFARLGTRPDVVRASVKHAVKAIIGYGDAFLYAHGRYHWSYAEKQRRLRSLGTAPWVLRELYDRAAEFRFEPDYVAWTPRDPERWNRELLDALSEVHLAVERIRLDAPTLEWREHTEVALAHVPFEDATRWREWARKLRTAAHGASPALAITSAGKLGARLASPSTRLAVAFPAVAYDVGSLARTRAAALLGVAASDRDEVRTAYLARWGEHADPGFSAVVRRFGLDLDAWRAA